MLWAATWAGPTKESRLCSNATAIAPPIAPPTCRNVLMTPDAAPASCGAIPRIPTVITTAKPQPRPRPVTTSGSLKVADDAVVEADAISHPTPAAAISIAPMSTNFVSTRRSEEHMSELQSPDHLVCRLLLEKKKNNRTQQTKRHSNHDRT